VTPFMPYLTRYSTEGPKPAEAQGKPAAQSGTQPKEGTTTAAAEPKP
jgi:hypothetical protein